MNAITTLAAAWPHTTLALCALGIFIAGLLAGRARAAQDQPPAVPDEADAPRCSATCSGFAGLPPRASWPLAPRPPSEAP